MKFVIKLVGRAFLSRWVLVSNRQHVRKSKSSSRMRHWGYFKGFFLIAFFTCLHPAIGADQITLQLKKSGNQGEIGLHSQMGLPVSAMYPEYVIQQSSNLVDWTTVAGPFSGGVGVSDELLRIAVPTPGSQLFYRTFASVKVAAGGSGIGDAI